MIDIKSLENNFPEKALIILASRLTLSEEERTAIKRIVEHKKINWFEFAKLALYHKTIVICWNNIKNICSYYDVPRYLLDVINYIYICTQEYNECYQKELNQLLQKCKSKNLMCIPVKGAYLIPNMYIDYGLRYSGDIDILIKHDDIEEMSNLVKSMGYINGRYVSKTRQVEPASRESEIKWKMHMSNLLPFIKLCPNKNFHYYKIDFRYALDDSLDKQPIREIIEEKGKLGYTIPAYYFIHMCTHFYNEAKHSASIASFKDFNMIKLCDLREFILRHMTPNDFSIAIDFCIRYNLEKSLYYSLYYLNEIFSDGYEISIMEKLNIEDKTFLNTYGESTMNDNIMHSKTLEERLFSCGSFDEIFETPRFFRNS
jgi:hypothetical protein